MNKTWITNDHLQYIQLQKKGIEIRCIHLHGEPQTGLQDFPSIGNYRQDSEIERESREKKTQAGLKQRQLIVIDDSFQNGKY